MKKKAQKYTSLIYFAPSRFSWKAANKPIVKYNNCISKMQTCIFHWNTWQRFFRKRALKYRFGEWISVYLKLLYGSSHSSLVASSFTSTCIFSSRSRLFSFISNVSIGNLSEIPWESGIRTRFSFRNLWRKKRKSCRNFCEV